MAIDQQLVELMTQEVTWRQVTARDRYDARTWGSDQTVGCYIDEMPEIVRDDEGETVTATHTVYLDGVYAVALDDEIELPDGSTPPIVKVRQLTDDVGAHSTIVHLGG